MKKKEQKSKNNKFTILRREKGGNDFLVGESENWIEAEIIASKEFKQVCKDLHDSFHTSAHQDAQGVLGIYILNEDVADLGIISKYWEVK